jgi:hypothetical protein
VGEDGWFTGLPFSTRYQQQGTHISCDAADLTAARSPDDVSFVFYKAFLINILQTPL